MNDIAGERVGPMLNPPHLGEFIRESVARVIEARAVGAVESD